MKSLLMLLARWLLCAVFLVAAVYKVLHWEATSLQLEDLDLQMVPLLLAGAIAVEILGGLSLFVGSWTRTGALVLLLFMIPTTLLFHDFWTVAAEQRNEQMHIFFRNCGIMGGLLYVIANGPGRFSRDYRRRSKERTSEKEYEDG